MTAPSVSELQARLHAAFPDALIEAWRPLRVIASCMMPCSTGCPIEFMRWRLSPAHLPNPDSSWQ